MDKFEKTTRCFDCGQIIYPEEASTDVDGLVFCEICSDDLPREDDWCPEEEITADYSGPNVMATGCRCE